jgi:hypothetical protein
MPIATATPGWGLTAISSGPGASEKGAADDAALSHAQIRNSLARVSDRADNQHPRSLKAAVSRRLS